MRFKTWEDLTPPQKEHVVMLANRAGVPMINVTTGVYHTRGDFVSGSAWQFMKVWGIYVGPALLSYAMVAARTEDEVYSLIQKVYGKAHAVKVEELFTVAGVVEPAILKLLP